MRKSTRNKVVGLVALAGAWGLAKSYLLSRGTRSRRAEELGGLGLAISHWEAASAVSPGHLASSVVLGPLYEEVLYRALLQPRVGLRAASGVFGMGHYDPDVPLAMRVAKVIDATAGGALYGLAFALGGLPASVAAHAAHNLGASLGSAAGLTGR
jgi:membrane protease YdiL (CAAX protease family)